MLKAFVFSLVGFLPLLAAGKCDELDGATPEMELRYLNGDRSTVTPDCVSRAVHAIAFSTPDTLARQGEAIQVIVTYLDYRLPEEKNIYARAVSSNVAPYPATNALNIIGKPAVPAIVDAIGSGTLSDVARKNAVWTLLLIFSRDGIGEHVRVLSSASRAEPSREISLRLFVAAELAVTYCGRTNMAKCKEALYQTVLGH